MSLSICSLVVTLGALSAGGTALVNGNAPSQNCVVAACESKATATSPCCTTVVHPAVASVAASPNCAAYAITTSVTCDPKLVVKCKVTCGDGACSKAKKSGQSSCGSGGSCGHGNGSSNDQKAQIERDVSRAREDAHRGQLEALAAYQGARGQQADAQSLQETLERYRQDAGRYAERRDQMGRELAQLHGLRRTGQQSEELAQAQAALEQAQAASEQALAGLHGLQGADGDSIREQVRSALSRARGLGHQRVEPPADADDTDDDSDDQVAAEMADEGACAGSDDSDADDHDLEARVRALEELAHGRGQDVDTDEDHDSKSLEERVALLERLMKRSATRMPGFSMFPKLRMSELPRMEIEGMELRVLPNGLGAITIPRGVPPASGLESSKKSKGDKWPGKVHTWTWSNGSSAGDDAGADDVAEAPEAPEAAEAPEAPEAPQSSSPRHAWGAAPAPLARVEADTRHEIEALMRDMRMQIESMRTEMERLREELSRTPRQRTR